jgi:putative methionine-R-sulfoxide reductase with GAF domain
MLPTEDGQYLRPSRGSLVLAASLSNSFYVGEDRTREAERGVPGTSFSQSTALLVHDVERSPFFVDFESRQRLGSTSVLAVPINQRGRTVGVLSIDSTHRIYDELDATILTFISQLLGLGLASV